MGRYLAARAFAGWVGYYGLGLVIMVQVGAAAFRPYCVRAFARAFSR